MGEAGADIKLSPAAKKQIPYAFECKNHESLNIWKALKQAHDNATPGQNPVVIFKRNNSKTYAVIECEHFFKLIEDDNDL